MRPLSSLFALACALFAAFASFAAAAAGRPRVEGREGDALTFYVHTEDFADKVVRESLRAGEWDVYVSGAMVPGSTDRLKSFLSKRGIQSARIHLDSPGGNLLEGLKLGAFIREEGLTTSVSKRSEDGSKKLAICASACAYAFAGGVGRYYDTRTGRLGLHQFYGNIQQSSVVLTQALSGLVLSYLTKMGISAEAFVAASLSAPTSMHWLSNDEAASTAFSNNGAQPTVAEIKTLDLHPYLRIEQSRFAVTVRVLLTCIGGSAELAVGLVTSPEASLDHATGNARSYIDLDNTELLPVLGDEGVEASGSVLWMRRRVDAQFLSRLRRADSVGGHAYAGGAITWGDSLDLRGVRPQLDSYVEQCQAALRGQ